MRHSTFYTILFAGLICVVCGVMVSSAAVSLADQQKANAKLDRQKKVLEAAGLTEPGEEVSAERVAELFERIESVAVDVRAAEERPDFDLSEYDPRKAINKAETSYAAPANNSAIQRVPNIVPVYKVRDESGALESLVLPIEGLGLWGTLYGYIALDSDFNTVRGITYYEHKETPGLGGEVDNLRWKALWPGRKVYDESGEVALEVIKGQAGPASIAPYSVDGLSGATLTARGVTLMLDFWLGERAFGPYIENLAEQTPDEGRAA